MKKNLDIKKGGEAKNKLLLIWEQFIASMMEVPQKPILTNLIIVGVLSILLISLSYPYWNSKGNHEEYWHSVLIEGHGMILDLLIIGVLLLWFNKKGEKQQRIRQNLDEIEDFKLWKSEEASYKIMGNIKRLNRDKIYKIDLSSAYLVNTNLNSVILIDSNLNNADMSRSSISSSNFQGSRLNRANLENTKMHNANLKGSFLSGANFYKSELIKADLSGANCMMANFEAAILMEANMTDANFLGASFKDANLYKADFSRSKGITVEQLMEAKSINKALFDEKLMEKIREQAPEMLND